MLKTSTNTNTNITTKAKQRYRCQHCAKTFIISKTKNLRYPAKAAISALILYHRGHTLAQTSKQINRRFKLNTSKRTIHSWLHRYKDLCTYHKERKALKLQNPIQTKLLHHIQTYRFQFHKIKTTQRTPYLRNYFNHILTNYPHHLFENSLRCSQLKLDTNTITKIQKTIIQKKTSILPAITKLALSATKQNKDRHKIVQDFLLACDRTTIAAEVPIYLLPNENHLQQTITGHIDIIQERFNKLYILDYKPNAYKETRKNGTFFVSQKPSVSVKPTAQLYSYALALSKRANIPLNRIICGWFDHKNYFEFSPTLFAQRKII